MKDADPALSKLRPKDRGRPGQQKGVMIARMGKDGLSRPSMVIEKISQKKGHFNLYFMIEYFF
jgi:hypothetical protein